MQEIIRLNEVIYDKRASDGTWCTLPYPGHKKGCVNFPDCPPLNIDFKKIEKMQWYAVIEHFDLRSHELEYLKKPWCKTRRQARCVLYWQGKVRKKLNNKVTRFYNNIKADIYLSIPEACGVNVFATMAKHGIYLKSDPDLVYKIMLVGKKL